jgi:lipopolysaccharide export system ATP-binding protein
VSDARLEALGLKKEYGQKVAVNDVSFQMNRGEIVGLMGPNGAGKTTVFYMIVGFIAPTSGSILLNGERIDNKPMYKRARAGIAYLPQEASVFRKMTVEDNVRCIVETRKDIPRSAHKEKTEQLLEELGIARLRKQYAYTLSGGERRRTEIARALAIEPKFLLLDEPFAGIDPKAVEEIKIIVSKLSGKNIGVLITDHNVRETLSITSRCYLLHEGEILESGSSSELLENQIVRDVYLGEHFSL